jgi:hypothetical protein
MMQVDGAAVVVLLVFCCLRCTGWGTVLILLDVSLSLLSAILYIVGTYFPITVSVKHTCIANACNNQQQHLQITWLMHVGAAFGKHSCSLLSRMAAVAVLCLPHWAS